MAEQPFMMHTRKFPNGMVLELSGDLTKSAEAKLIAGLEQETELGRGIRFLALDLSKVVYINSGGMAVLIRLARMGSKAGVHTFSWGVTPHYEKLFRMVGLTEYMMIYPNEFAVMQRIEALNL
ncbi:stage II sporulation protein AA (anti-sigma F factor antagonist) [Paenibacillus sp. UNC496MF]|uniref:STAS domain-containing protein n=1 Tax=Paenibacillus sp. UNC496MF TaxID=1502753 RepID=UPI0008EF06BE|nr:STAS domain-containing protein [Paenibacillus sp. UNC496MF]SFJ27471.1 stage II sporulation protein AA (anti-sigma F factor antagonist) [Paenibacillus sp. UNC496MF]